MSVLILALAVAATSAAYDPRHVDSPEVTYADFTAHDGAHAREIPVRVYLPKNHASAPVILYSHGLGGSRETSAFLGEHWAGRGYVAVFMQHPGSDVSVWEGKKPGEAMVALREAASVKEFMHRVGDVHAVLDALTVWNGEKENALHDRMDLSKVGMSGHSFGAVTTQAVSGEQFPLGSGFTDPRIKAAAIFSPSKPKRGDSAHAFGAVKMPWLLMTGTRDDSPLGDMPAAARLEVFSALPAGRKYQLVLDGAEHSVFTDRMLPGESGTRNPNHHPAIAAITTAFFDAYLRGDPDAQAWLDGEGARSVLDAKDAWSKK